MLQLLPNISAQLNSITDGLSMFRPELCLGVLFLLVMACDCWGGYLPGGGDLWLVRCQFQAVCTMD